MVRTSIDRGVLRTNQMAKVFGYYGFLAGIAGLGLFITFTLYLSIQVIWSLWLAILLLRIHN